MPNKNAKTKRTKKQQTAENAILLLEDRGIKINKQKAITIGNLAQQNFTENMIVKKLSGNK